MKKKQPTKLTNKPKNQNQKNSKRKSQTSSICNMKRQRVLSFFPLHESINFIMTILYLLFLPLSCVSLQYLFSNNLFRSTCPAKSCKLLFGILIAFPNNLFFKFSTCYFFTAHRNIRTVCQTHAGLCFLG